MTGIGHYVEVLIVFTIVFFIFTVPDLDSVSVDTQKSKELDLRAKKHVFSPCYCKLQYKSMMLYPAVPKLAFFLSVFHIARCFKCMTNRFVMYKFFEQSCLYTNVLKWLISTLAVQNKLVQFGTLFYGSVFSGTLFYH